MYNLEDKVDGLDVVDFPGVDDRDESISGLADLLLTLAQIIIFVVDYRYSLLDVVSFVCTLFSFESVVQSYCELFLFVYFMYYMQLL